MLMQILALSILLPGRSVYAQTAEGTPASGIKTLSQTAMEILAGNDNTAVDATLAENGNTAGDAALTGKENAATETSLADNGTTSNIAPAGNVSSADNSSAAEIQNAGENHDPAGSSAVAESLDIDAGMIGTQTASWNGRKLSRKLGTVNGPSGKETYYNLNMLGIINSLKSHGSVWQDIDPALRQNVAGDYYVRSDGCKMLGPYIMVAAHLGVHPRGSLVETTLGTGVVVDTGAFARSNAHQIDVAVNW